MFLSRSELITEPSISATRSSSSTSVSFWKIGVKTVHPSHPEPDFAPCLALLRVSYIHRNNLRHLNILLKYSLPVAFSHPFGPSGSLSFGF